MNRVFANTFVSVFLFSLSLPLAFYLTKGLDADLGLGFMLMGPVAGAIQAFVVHARIGKGLAWFLMTSLGFFAGWWVIILMGFGGPFYLPRNIFSALQFGGQALAIGLAQWLVIRKSVNSSFVWIVFSVIGGLLFSFLSSPAFAIEDDAAFLLGYLGYGLIIGLCWIWHARKSD